MVVSGARGSAVEKQDVRDFVFQDELGSVFFADSNRFELWVCRGHAVADVLERPAGEDVVGDVSADGGGEAFHGHGDVFLDVERGVGRVEVFGVSGGCTRAEKRKCSDE
jgi:hypothetical protein